jgi:DMSO/TMAO reductase YedYZ heme-binding membrane subunit
MMDTIVAAIKKHRLVWSCALLVALFLLLVGHVPTIPVLVGCALAIAYATLRSPQSRQPNLKTAPVRGGRRT